MLLELTIKLNLHVGTKLRAYDSENEEWLDAEIISVMEDVEAVRFRDEIGMEWDDFLGNLGDTGTYEFVKKIR